MAVPKFDELMDPGLRVHHELGGLGSTTEIEDGVTRLLGLSEVDAAAVHRGTMTQLRYRLTWARSYLKQTGLVERSARGVWALTALGRETPAVDRNEVRTPLLLPRAERVLM